MLNPTGQYPLRAMIFPAQYVVDWLIHRKQIAEHFVGYLVRWLK